MASSNSSSKQVDNGQQNSPKSAAQPPVIRKSFPRYYPEMGDLKQEFMNLVREVISFSRQVDPKDLKAICIGLLSDVTSTERNKQEDINELKKCSDSDCITHLQPYWDPLDCDLLYQLIRQLQKPELMTDWERYKVKVKKTCKTTLAETRRSLPQQRELPLHQISVGFQTDQPSHDNTIQKILDLRDFLRKMMGLEEADFEGFDNVDVTLFYTVNKIRLPFLVQLFALHQRSLQEFSITVVFVPGEFIYDVTTDQEFAYPKQSPDSQQLLEQDMDLLQLVAPTMIWEEEIRQKEEEERRQEEEEERRQKEEEERRRTEEERQQKEAEERRQKEEEERRRTEEEERQQKEAEERRQKEEAERRKKEEKERRCNDIFSNLAFNMKECTKEARTVASYRDYGSQRMKESADEFDEIFIRAEKYLFYGTVTAATVGIAAAVLTGGMAAPVVGAGVAAGVAYFIVMILKWISENRLLRETDDWIMSDRENFKNLLKASDFLNEALEELESLKLSKHEANMYLRQHCGFSIDIDLLKDLKRTLDILRGKGLASGDEETQKRATEEVEKRMQEFLEYNRRVPGWWFATIYTDTEGIGRVGGEVTWRIRKRAPVGDLVRVVADAMSEDKEMGPIKKIGKLYDNY